MTAAAFYYGGRDQFSAARAEGELAGQVALDAATFGVAKGLTSLRRLRSLYRANPAALQTGKSGPPFQLFNSIKFRQYFTKNLLAKFKKHKGRIIESKLPHKNKAVLGTYSPEKNVITLYPGHNTGTLAEELLHFEQARRSGWIGKTYREIAKEAGVSAEFLMKRIEKKISPLMLRGGFRHTRIQELK